MRVTEIVSLIRKAPGKREGVNPALDAPQLIYQERSNDAGLVGRFFSRYRNR
jgi:hypothetical protein